MEFRNEGACRVNAESGLVHTAREALSQPRAPGPHPLSCRHGSHADYGVGHEPRTMRTADATAPIRSARLKSLRIIAGCVRAANAVDANHAGMVVDSSGRPGRVPGMLSRLRWIRHNCPALLQSRRHAGGCCAERTRHERLGPARKLRCEESSVAGCIASCGSSPVDVTGNARRGLGPQRPPTIVVPADGRET